VGDKIKQFAGTALSPADGPAPRPESHVRYRSKTPVAIFLSLLLCLGLAALVAAEPVTHHYTKVGLLGVNVTNLGYIGHAFSNPGLPSGEYPLNSNVEHIYRGGLWIGARTSDGTIHVSTGAQDASNLQAGDEIREFRDYSANEDSLFQYVTTVWSNNQNSDDYHPDAVATQQINLWFHDYTSPESGSHTPLGLHVYLRTLAWSIPYADDFVILDYSLVNISGADLSDVYLGFWCDTTVGNTENTDPYDPQAPVGWNYYDDKNGGWGPEGLVPPDYAPAEDPGIWMAHEHDADGDEGLAVSWIGYRLLGTSREAAPAEGVRPVSYNAWSFKNLPDEDDWYIDPGDPDSIPQIGKYQLMSNGDFDVGETQETDFTMQGNWVSIISTGPFAHWADGDTLRMTWAVAAGPDSLGLLANSKVAQLAYDEGFVIPAGPPSPILDFAFADDSVIMRWAPGDSLDAAGNPLPTDSPLRSPEHHISRSTNKPDFQGYRVYRYQGETISQDPYSLATLVAEYDKIDGVGFDTGLPPLNDEGLREVVDTDLLDGFPYWYSVVSFSAPDLIEGLPEFQSGFNENARLVYPGPSPSTPDRPRTVGVYPNPYRAASLFDSRSGEQELGRKIWFTGLPARCRIQIFTLAGDLVQTLHHDDPSSGQEPWDLLSGHTRSIASGLYVYVVEDEDSGDIQRGKLVIIK